MFVVKAELGQPFIKITPSLEDIQETISKAAKIIVSASKAIGQWAKQRKVLGENVSGLDCSLSTVLVIKVSYNILVHRNSN
jgi:hypothetical protein